jgi:hypothetical protein
MPYRGKQSEACRAWQAQFLDSDNQQVEKIPNPRGSREMWDLPVYQNKNCLYDMYLDSVRNSGLLHNQRPASISTFRSVWRKHHSHVVTPKHHKFSKCTECTRLRHIVTTSQDHTARRKAKAQRNLHFNRIKRERNFLNTALWKSIVNPEKVFLFEIDGMDSAKTLLPHVAEKTKAISAEVLVQYHLTCVKHNGTRPDDVYYFTNEKPHNSEHTCTVIWKTIMKVRTLNYDVYSCSTRSALRSAHSNLILDPTGDGTPQG